MAKKKSSVTILGDEDECCYGIMTQFDMAFGDPLLTEDCKRQGPLIWESYPMTLAEAEQAAKSKGKVYGWVKVVRIVSV